MYSSSKKDKDDNGKTYIRPTEKDCTDMCKPKNGLKNKQLNMKISFEITRTNRSKTECPYGYIDGYEGKVKKVGSYACHDCMHFVSVDLEKREVECKCETTISNRK